MEGKKRAAGVVIYAVVNRALVAVLPRRASYDPEKNMAPQSFAGALQVTAHGGVKESEDVIDGLRREAREEIGIGGNIFCKKNMEVLSIVNKPEKEVITYGLVVPIEFVKNVRFSLATDGYVLLRREQVSEIIPLNTNDKPGVPHEFLAMFQDEIDAISKGFEIFASKQQVAELVKRPVFHHSIGTPLSQLRR